MLPLHDLAATHLFSDVATVLALTARHSAGAVYAPALASYVNSVFAADAARCPSGIAWHYPGRGGLAATWKTEGQLPLSALAKQIGTSAADILQVTADVAGSFPGAAACYVNDVFARSALHVPAGAVLYYGAA